MSFGYQWQRCDAAGRGCAAIPARVGRTYTPTAADVGHALLVRVSAVTPAGTASASSCATLAVAASGATGGAAPKAQKLPTVQGGNQVGQVLTAQVGTWTGSPTSYSYQWRRCATGGTACVAIAGAGGITYTTSPGDIGSVISLDGHRDRQGRRRLGDGGSDGDHRCRPRPGTGDREHDRAGRTGRCRHDRHAASRPRRGSPARCPNQAAVGLVDATSHLSLKGTSVRLSFGAVAPLPWPIDVQYPAAPADAVPGILPLQGVWQPLAELPTPILPPAQQAGTYRDAAGTLHLLTRTAGPHRPVRGRQVGRPALRHRAEAARRARQPRHRREERRREQRRLRQDHARHAGAPLRHPRARRTARSSCSRRRARGSAAGWKASPRRRCRRSSSSRALSRSASASPPPSSGRRARTRCGSRRSTRTGGSRRWSSRSAEPGIGPGRRRRVEPRL